MSNFSVSQNMHLRICPRQKLYNTQYLSGIHSTVEEEDTLLEMTMMLFILEGLKSVDYLYLINVNIIKNIGHSVNYQVSSLS